MYTLISINGKKQKIVGAFGVKNPYHKSIKTIPVYDVVARDEQDDERRHEWEMISKEQEVLQRVNA